jgi:AraC-like DNA-binding protein
LPFKTDLLKKILRELSLSANSSFLIKEEIATQFVAPFHFHRGYEFAFIVKGHGKFYGGDRLLNFTEGDLYLFGVGFPHYFVTEKTIAEAGELVHSIIIQFPEDFLGHDFYLKPEFKPVKELLKSAEKGIKITDPSIQLKQLINDLLKLSGLKALIHLIQLLEIVSSLPKSDVKLISSDAYKSLAKKYDGEDKLEAVYKYVLENFKEDVNTKKAASLAFMNEAAFCRYFKRRTHKTLSQFINNVRITHATSLLAEKGVSVSNVCFECGFDNLSYFNRQFKAIIGKTPFAYRKEF